MTGLEHAAVSQKYCLNLEELSAIYENGLKHEYEDIDKLKIIINPLPHMLSLLPICGVTPSEYRRRSQYTR